MATLSNPYDFWTAQLREAKIGNHDVGGWWFNHATQTAHDVSSDAGGGTNDHMGYVWASESHENGKKLGIEPHHVEALRRAYTDYTDDPDPEGAEWGEDQNEAVQAILSKNTRVSTFRYSTGKHSVGVDTGGPFNRALGRGQDAIRSLRSQGHHIPDHADLFWDHGHMDGPGQIQTKVGDFMRAGSHRDITPIKHSKMEGRSSDIDWDAAGIHKYWYNHDTGKLHRVAPGDHHIDFAHKHPEKLRLDAEQQRHNDVTYEEEHYADDGDDEGGLPAVPHVSTLKNNIRIAAMPATDYLEMNVGGYSPKHLRHAQDALVKMKAPMGGNVTHTFRDMPWAIQSTVTDTLTAKNYHELEPTHPMWRIVGESMIEATNPDDDASFIGQYHEATAKGWVPHPKYTRGEDDEGGSYYHTKLHYPHEPEFEFHKMTMVHPDFPGADLTISGHQGWFHSDSRGYGMGQGKHDASLRQYLTKYHASPSTAPDEKQVFDEGKVEMPRDEFKREHQRLVRVLRSGSKRDREREAADQERELQSEATYETLLVAAGQDPYQVLERFTTRHTPRVGTGRVGVNQ